MPIALKKEELHKIIPSKDQFNKFGAWGLYSGIDIHNCDPDIIRDEEMIRQYIIQLCDLLEMKRFNEAQVVHFGNDERIAGFSMVQLIETSLISGHFANLTNSAYIDVFSCRYYDPEVIAHFSLSFFKGSEYSLNVILRK